MNPIMLSILFRGIDVLGPGVNFDAGGPILVLGFFIILAVGIGIIILTVVAVKYLIRIRKNKTKND